MDGVQILHRPGRPDVETKELLLGITPQEGDEGDVRKYIALTFGEPQRWVVDVDRKVLFTVVQRERDTSAGVADGCCCDEGCAPAAALLLALAATGASPARSSRGVPERVAPSFSQK